MGLDAPRQRFAGMDGNAFGGRSEIDGRPLAALEYWSVITPTRHASCRCGEIRIACTGEPIRVSVCHCRECKARSGSAFAVQVRFPAEQVRTEGEAKLWQYTGESGHTADFFFCPNCGSGVWYRARPYHDAYAIPLGNFEPGHGFMPGYSVWEEHKEPWVSITGEGIDHDD